MHSLVALLFPRTCLLCGDRAEDPHNLCGECIRDLPGIGACCRRCALPLPVPGTEVCAQCTIAPPPFRRAVAALRYLQPVDTLIRQLKFEGNLAVAPTLGWLLARRVGEEDDASVPECIVPVPLHRRRLRARGFNQSLEIARAVATATGVPVRRDWTRRTRDTPVQSRTQSVRGRGINVRGAFSASRRLARFRHVAILDDVVTTGATASELARIVLAAGVERVDLWCVARAERGASARDDHAGAGNAVSGADS